MNRYSLPRILLAACAGLLSLIAVLTLIHAPTIVIASGDPPSEAPTSNFQPPISRTGTLCFVSEGVVSCVNRIAIQTTGTLTDQVRSLMQTMVDGPTAAEGARGIRSALPAGVALADVMASPERVVVRFDLPASYLASFDAGDAEDVNEQVATTLTPFNFARIDVEARDPDRPDTFRLLSTFLPPITIPKKPGEPTGDQHRPSSLTGGQPPEYGNPQASGGLRGRTVFVSAGHGWYWLATQGRYRTQRPHYPSAPYPSGEGIIEDFNNAEIVNQVLLQYLWNAGADAWTVRERDTITSMHIVDNISPTFTVEGDWLTGSTGGWGSMGVLSGTYRYTTTLTSGATATATWTFTPALDAEYAVYVWFPNAANRTAAARYGVDHAGGTTVLTITQARDGIDWRYIGTYPFRGGAAYRVRLTNQSTAPGLNVLADAIRIGGGVGDFAPTGIPPSFKPRWEEQALRYAQWVGLPDAENLNDVIVRPIFSEWEYESGEDGIYISYHTNGFTGYNTTARGTETYIHSSEPTPNSDVLQDFVHAELLNDIHTGWEAAWPDRGQKSRDLGELRLLEAMPGVLIENGYHDNPQDVEAEKDPRFNLLSARAIYQGIVRYWNSRDPNVPLVFLPEPPAHLRVRNSGPNQVTLEWRPGPTDTSGLLGHMATAYRVYTSTDGFGWGNAIDTSNTSLALSGLASGQLIFVRVTGVNAGGESFPTPVLAARVAGGGVAPVLIVHGFDRIDRSGLIRQLDGAEGYNRRMFLDRINRYDTIVQHATGITLAFDSAVHAAVTDGYVGLGNYTIVDWIGGEEESPDVVLNATDQSLLQAHLDGGGALLISGAEIGNDLVANGAGPSFYTGTLHAAFVDDDAGTYNVVAVSGGVFEGFSPFSFDDGTHGTYDVDRPDVFTPLGGASSALMYNGGLGGTAALTYSSGPCTRLVYVGFPIETVYPQATRDALVSRAMAFLDDCIGPPPDTAIASPADGAAYNVLPPFNGTAEGPGLSAVQVAILSGSLYYDGSAFATAQTWLTATGAAVWSYALPPLTDGAYALKARAFVSSLVSDTTPAVVTFTYDTAAPVVPSLITPTGGLSLLTFAPTFVFTSAGDPAGFEFALDGVTETLASPATGFTRTVTDGPHTWRARAFDRAGNVSAWSGLATFTSYSLKSYLPLIAKDFTAGTGPIPPTCYEAIVNGGFELGFTGWITPSFRPPPAIVSSPVFTGGQAVRVGSAVTSSGVITQLSFSSVQQAATIPASAISATLSFQRYRISGDTVNDLQYVALLSGNAVLDYLVYERLDDPAWTAAQYDLLAYAGQTLNLRFSVKNDGTGGATGMYIDDVSLQVCTP